MTLPFLCKIIYFSVSLATGLLERCRTTLFCLLLWLTTSEQEDNDDGHDVDPIKGKAKQATVSGDNFRS
jgi:hypothetical protein